MTIKQILASCLLAITSLSVCAQSDARMKAEFENALKEKGTQINTIQCDFKQTRSMAVLANDVIKTGKFHYQRPDRILLSFDDGDFIKMVDENFQMRNAGKTIKAKTSMNAMLRELKRMLSACMTGEILQVTNEFQCEMAATHRQYTMKLVPKKKKMSSKVKDIELVFNRDDMSLECLKMTEASGDYTMYEFTGKKFNTAVDAHLFK